MQTVDRALTILEELARGGPRGVTEIAAAIGVHKSTASRLLATLERHGLVEQDGRRGAYALGFGLVRLAGAVDGHRDVARHARASCEAIAARLGETANFALLDGDAAINLCQATGPGAIAARDWTGRSTPLHCTASGKVLLAWASPEMRERLLGGTHARFTEHTLTTRAALRAELDAVRAGGWAVTREEYELGLNAVAAPVRAAGGGVVGALSVSGPAYRLDDAALVAAGEVLLEQAEALGRRLGHVDAAT